MITVEYAVENEKPVIYVFDRDEEGKRVTTRNTTYRPYFYVLKEDEHKFVGDKRVILTEDSTSTDIQGRRVVKVVCKLPKFVPELRTKTYTHFESDILYPTRYTIDTYKELVGKPLHTCYLDIETNTNKKFPNVRVASEEITCLSCYNNQTRKLITFVWRPDFKEETTDEGKKELVIEGRPTKEYDDYTMRFSDETRMLTKWAKYMSDNDFDLITGWNVRNFDLAYIITRMNNLGIDTKQLSPLKSVVVEFYKDTVEIIMKGRIIFDMFEAYKQMTLGELESYRLENVAFTELGEGKIKFNTSFSDLWTTKPDVLVEYNKKDVMLVYKIQSKKQIIQSFDEIRRLSKCSFNDVFNASRVVDCFVLSFCKDKYVLPTKQQHQKEYYKGGQVFKPVKGVHSWVSVFDYKALYPKIISSINASPETLLTTQEDGAVNLKIPYVDFALIQTKPKQQQISELFNQAFEEQWNIQKQEFDRIPQELQPYLKYKQVYYTQKTKGFIPEILEHIFSQRVSIQKDRDKYDYSHPEYKRLEFKQYAYKVMSNSFYGTIGSHKFRLYRPEIAASITFIGRNAVLWNRFVSKKNGYKVLYGDTDSVMIRINNTNTINDIVEESRQIQKFLQESYKEFSSLYNITNCYLEIEFEKVFSKVFFGQAKKRYAGIISWYKGKVVNDFKVVGFEVVRSDQSKLARQTQQQVFRMVLEGKSMLEVNTYIKEVAKNITNNQYDYEQIGIPTPLNKPVGQYITNTPTVRAVKNSNSYLKLDLRPGEKFLLIHTKSLPGHPSVDVIGVRNKEDVPEGTLIDYAKHVEEAAESKIKSIYDGLGWTINTNTTKTQTSFSEFST